MAKKMLIDATHAEETRVAVVDGYRLLEYDYESKVRKQLKGSIFLAKVTRVEPSLQAAFVNFGGNRHGFLPFSEIHPDYYRIPIADREKLLAEQEEAFAQEEDSEDRAESDSLAFDSGEFPLSVADSNPNAESDDEDHDILEEVGGAMDSGSDDSGDSSASGPSRPTNPENSADSGSSREDGQISRDTSAREQSRTIPHRSRQVEVVGGDSADGERPRRPNLRRQYKIQEVIKRGQIMLIQASKEERGNKGAAVTTYLSLPGRYGVLMPNSPRGGGVSRKISSGADRQRMKEILAELNVPQGMSVILRTAGVGRTKVEIKRDLDYLMRLWDDIRDQTLKSTAPALIYEEGNLIKRAIRDIYTRDIEDIIIAGHDSFKTAREFIRMLIPSHVKKVHEYTDPRVPLFHRYQVESQIVEIGEPEVRLPSGGSLVINPTEALVSVDVNSGRATRERHIEETALKTNLEAAEELSRQLRLRDLGGLVVVDFIDMEDRRNNAKVERRFKDALSSDRARIQVGRISSFGLLELSRQRMNPSLTESQYIKCPHCHGLGHIRTVDAAAITALRAVEDEGIRGRFSEVALSLPTDVAIYILNNKRVILADIEKRYGFRILIQADGAMAPSDWRVEPVRDSGERGGDSGSAPQSTAPRWGREADALPSPVRERRPAQPESEENGEEEEDEDEDSSSLSAVSGAPSEQSDSPSPRTARRRGRRGGRRRGGRNRDEIRGEDSESPESRTSENDTLQTEPDSSDILPPEQPGSPGQTEAPDAPEPEQAATPSPRRKRASPARRGQRKTSTEEQNSGESVPSEAHEPENPPEEPPARPVRKSRARVQPKALPAANEDHPLEPGNESSPLPQSQNPVATPLYDVVTEAPPEKRKKGWWNKLIE